MARSVSGTGHRRRRTPLTIAGQGFLTQLDNLTSVRPRRPVFLIGFAIYFIHTYFGGCCQRPLLARPVATSNGCCLGSLPSLYPCGTYARASVAAWRNIGSRPVSLRRCGGGVCTGGCWRGPASVSPCPPFASVFCLSAIYRYRTAGDDCAPPRVSLPPSGCGLPLGLVTSPLHSASPGPHCRRDGRRTRHG